MGIFLHSYGLPSNLSVKFTYQNFTDTLGQRPLREIYFGKQNSPTRFYWLVSWESSDDISRYSIFFPPKFCQYFTPLVVHTSGYVNSLKTVDMPTAKRNTKRVQSIFFSWKTLDQFARKHNCFFNVVYNSCSNGTNHHTFFWRSTVSPSDISRAVCLLYRRVASEIFKLLLVSLDKLSGCFSNVVM